MMRRPSSKTRFDEISDAEILDGGVPPAPGTQPSPPPPPDYRGVTAPQTCMKGLATSISLDEAILAEQQRKGTYPCTPKEARLSNAGSNQGGYHGNAFLPPIHVVLRNNSKDGGKPVIGTPPVMGQNVDINAKEYFNYIWRKIKILMSLVWDALYDRNLISIGLRTYLKLKENLSKNLTNQNYLHKYF